MVTELGKFLRKLRIDNGELLADMANKLGVSPAFLSRVENGNKRPSSEWEEIITNEYGLEQSQKEELSVHLFEAMNMKNIDISHYDKSEKDLMLAFARKIDTFDENRLQAIKKLIEESE